MVRSLLVVIDDCGGVCLVGAQALADGRLGPDGTFEANKIQAKCASKYEAKPLQRGLSHDAAVPARISRVLTVAGNIRS